MRTLIGEEDQTVAEIVQGMYYEGFGFIHFCAQSIATILIELAAIVGAIVDIVLVGIPARGPNGLEAGPLSDFIRKKFDEVFFQLLLSR